MAKESDKNYLEVVGSAEIEEKIEKFRASITITVRAASREVAMSECLELRRLSIEALLASGLQQNELQEGGVDIAVPWYQRKKVGLETDLRILLTSTDSQRILLGLAALEPFFQNQRHQLEVHMLPPEYAEDQQARENGLAQAFVAARSKAERLAQQAGVRLGPPLLIEELGVAKQSSGMMGDYGGWPAAAAASRGLAAEDAPKLDNPCRSISFRVLVRFALPA